MKKRIPTILLLISPYLFLFIFTSNIYSEYLSFGKIFLINCSFLAIVFIFNMIYPFVLAKHGENSTKLLFWDMLLKLFNIPIYIAVFMFGTMMAFLPKGIVITPFLVFFDYILLLPSSMYGISGLIQARREGKITTSTAVINSILHFFFVMDIISAIIMFFKVKTKDKEQINL